MTSEVPDAEEFSRPAKALVDAGLVDSFGDAEVRLAAVRPQLMVGSDAMSLAHHAAVLTVVETAFRAFGSVDLQLPHTIVNSQCLVPGLGELTIKDAVQAAGANVLEDLDSSRPAIAIGAPIAGNARVLQVTWDHWLAHVNINGQRLPERGNMPLAAVTAGALAVTECFKVVLGDLEATYRNRSLNLWQPNQNGCPSSTALPGPDLIGPIVQYLPAAAWIVGLGHLGQAFAWCWRLLPYADRAQCLLFLQDFDRVNSANRTTGVFVHPDSIGDLKTRVVASALEDAGFDTRLVERRLASGARRLSTEPVLALLGMDKVEPRRLISDVGWEFAVDVGLGSGPVDFTGINIHTFPAAGHSGTLQAWQQRESDRRSSSAMSQRAYRDAEVAGANPCGLVQLADTAVAAPFVGIVAACLAVAEPIRVLHGQDASVATALDAGRGQAVRRATKPTRARIPYVAAYTSA